MIRHRQGAPAGAGDNDSSSSDEDAFSALSRKNKKAKKANTPSKSEAVAAPNSTNNPQQQQQPPPPPAAELPLSTTSSMKRHHKEISDSRKAKMDALLMELEKDKKRAPSSSSSSTSHHHHHYVPEKKGSFVSPGEEGVTTNLFVGNLAPSISEEDLTELFRQFGDLYSVKIMWPRTAEERARQRHTGFVCFMNRPDAEDALHSCDDADPFNVGRRLTLRWGKNVKKLVKKGAGGTLIAPILRKQVAGGANTAGTLSKDVNNDNGGSNRTLIETKMQGARRVYDPQIHGSSSIRVVIPKDARRAQLISTVASFVAKDGSEFEQALAERERGNPAYNFLSYAALAINSSEEQQQQQQQEHIFYKWRVYAFCQGDGFYTWKTDPFCMIEQHGCFWIPPPVDQDAAQREKEQVRIKEEAIEREKQQRRLRSARRDYVTGRKLEQEARSRKGGPDGGAQLSVAEVKEFHRLFREQLCASREAICQAMAFCFEKSAAAKQVSDMLKDLLLDLGRGTSVETRIARLYLLSDILFNSQSPGVKLAFYYRDAIERMAPEVFAALGKNNDGTAAPLGRMSLNKLSNAVSSILAAWTNWSVYNPIFLDELQARFEGREIKPIENNKDQEEEEEEENETNEDNEEAEEDHAVITKPQGDWKEVDADQDEGGQLDPDEILIGDDNDDADGEPLVEGESASAPKQSDSGEGRSGDDDDTDGEPLGDADGEPLVNADGKPLGDADGEPLDDADGEPLGDADGEPLGDADGEPRGDADGEPLGDADGEPLGDADGEPYGGDQVDVDEEPLRDVVREGDIDDKGDSE